MEKILILRPAHVAIYKFVDDYIKKNGYSPEYREIQEGIKTTASLSERQVIRLALELVEMEYFSRVPNRKRNLGVLKPLPGSEQRSENLSTNAKSNASQKRIVKQNHLRKHQKGSGSRKTGKASDRHRGKRS